MQKMFCLSFSFFFSLKCQGLGLFPMPNDEGMLSGFLGRQCDARNMNEDTLCL